MYNQNRTEQENYAPSPLAATLKQHWSAFSITTSSTRISIADEPYVLTFPLSPLFHIKGGHTSYIASTNTLFTLGFKMPFTCMSNVSSRPFMSWFCYSCINSANMTNSPTINMPEGWLSLKQPYATLMTFFYNVLLRDASARISVYTTKGI